MFERHLRVTVPQTVQAMNRTPSRVRFADAALTAFAVLDSAAIYVHATDAVGQNVMRHRSGQGLARDHDRLMGGLEGGAPALPALGFGGGGGSEVD